MPPCQAPDFRAGHLACGKARIELAGPHHTDDARDKLLFLLLNLLTGDCSSPR